MQRISSFLLPFVLMLAWTSGTVSGADADVIEVRVSLPADVVGPPTLTGLQEACRHLSEKDPPAAAAALRRAAEGIQATVLGKNLIAAANAVTRPAGRFTPVSERGEIGSDPFFVLRSPGKKQPPEGFFCRPLPREENWMIQYLEDPSRLREDLPERMSGVTADMSALPRVHMVDLVVAEAPGRLSAWVNHPADPGMVVVFRNLVSAYCDQRLKKLGELVLAEPWSKKVDAKALEWLVAITRVAHGLGPVALEQETGKGMVSVASRLEDKALPVEAVKAEGLALIAGLRLAEAEKDLGVSAAGFTATFVIYLLDRVRGFSGDASNPFAVIERQLIKEGGIRLDLQSGRVIPDRRKLKAAMTKMLKRMVRSQGSGSDADAQDFFAPKEKADGDEDPFIRSIPAPIAGFKLVTKNPDPVVGK